LDSAHNILASVAKPWAKDANGLQIKTYFTTDGQTLTQHILHNVAGVVYPVTADPWFLVAALAAVRVAAMGCAANAAQGFIWQGAQWAIRRGEWNWTQRAHQAAEDCIQGAVFGWVGRFIPSAYKQWALNEIRGPVVNYLLWMVSK
jgi:hypothetical protein